MSLTIYDNPHRMAELPGEYQGWRYTMRFSSHYYNQGDHSTHWKCYSICYHDVKRCVEDEIPTAILKAINKRAQLVAIQLMKDYPPLVQHNLKRPKQEIAKV